MNLDLFFNALKGQFNTLNFILLLCLLAFILYKRNKVTLSLVLAAFALLFFMLASTAYLPGYLINRMETKYEPFNISGYPNTEDRVFIHVLGGGYTFDTRLSAQSKLTAISLGRLAEGLRISKLIPNSTLVVSGNIASGDYSMASVARMAAIDMGFDSLRIEMLETPATTQEEAKAFADLHGTEVKVILVTDAVHMPRAIGFFKEYGIHAYPAPTNYLIKHDNNPFALRWMPSIENFLLMDRILREFFGSIKGSIS